MSAFGGQTAFATDVLSNPANSCRVGECLTSLGACMTPCVHLKLLVVTRRPIIAQHQQPLPHDLRRSVKGAADRRPTPSQQHTHSECTQAERQPNHTQTQAPPVHCVKPTQTMLPWDDTCMEYEPARLAIGTLHILPDGCPMLLQHRASRYMLASPPIHVMGANASRAGRQSRKLRKLSCSCIRHKIHITHRSPHAALCFIRWTWLAC